MSRGHFTHHNPTYRYKLGVDNSSEFCQDPYLSNKTMSVKNGALEALYFDKIRGKIGKSVVAKETPRIATEHHVVLSFNLQAVYVFFPALGTLGWPGETWVGCERRW